jgi:hypothetical protein
MALFVVAVVNKYGIYIILLKANHRTTIHSQFPQRGGGGSLLLALVYIACRIL